MSGWSLSREKCSTVVMIASVALLSCHQAQDRGLDLADADVAADADGGIDSGPIRPLVTCNEPRIIDPIWEGEGRVEVTSIDRLVVGPYVIGGSQGSAGTRQAMVWLLSGIDFHVLSTNNLADEEWVDILHDPRSGVLLAVASNENRVTLYRLDFSDEWGLEVLSEREVCRACRPSHLAPAPGPGRTALVTEHAGSPEIQLHLVPDREDAEVITSEPLDGSRPVVVNGTFGPLVLFEREELLYVSQGHWDGTLSQAEEVRGGPFDSGYSATIGEENGLDLVAVERADPSLLAIISLDDEGHRIGRREFPDFHSASTFALSSNEISFFVAFIGPDVTGPVVHDIGYVLFSSFSSTPVVGIDHFDRPVGDLPLSIAAVADRTSHTVIWTELTNTESSRLTAAVLECQEE